MYFLVLIFLFFKKYLLFYVFSKNIFLFFIFLFFYIQKNIFYFFIFKIFIFKNIFLFLENFRKSFRNIIFTNESVVGTTRAYITCIKVQLLSTNHCI